MEPDRAEPELTALELRNGAYEQVARVSRDEPFPAKRAVTRQKPSKGTRSLAE